MMREVKRIRRVHVVEGTRDLCGPSLGFLLVSESSAKANVIRRLSKAVSFDNKRASRPHRSRPHLNLTLIRSLHSGQRVALSSFCTLHPSQSAVIPYICCLHTACHSLAFDRQEALPEPHPANRSFRLDSKPTSFASPPSQLHHFSALPAPAAYRPKPWIP